MARPQDRLRAAPRERRRGAPDGSRPAARCPHRPAGRGARPLVAGALRDPDSLAALKEDVMKRLIALTLMTFGWLMQAAAAPLPLASLSLPPGFAIEEFARVPNARQMALGTSTLFVGSMREGKVYAIPLAGAHQPVVIAEGFEMPVGVAFRNGDLYVSAVSRILRLADIEARLNQPPRPEVVSKAFPSDPHD